MSYKAFNALYAGQLAILMHLFGGPAWLSVTFAMISFACFVLVPAKDSPAPGQGGNDE